MERKWLHVSFASPTNPEEEGYANCLMTAMTLP